MHISAADLALAQYDENGIFLEGRRAELDILRLMGLRDASLGRLYEGHFNAALLVALYGGHEHRARAQQDIAAGEFFGVWNTQDADAVHLRPTGDRNTFVLSGAKTWASGADSVTRALITARLPDDSMQMCLVPMQRVSPTAIDASAWQPLGMHDSRSYRVDFTGVILDASDLIGSGDDYQREPWFHGGAVRFAAVHAGIVDRISRETLEYAITRKREHEPLLRERIANMQIATHSCIAWLRLAGDAWHLYDLKPNVAQAQAVTHIADMTRIAIERAALSALEDMIRSVGAHGMLESLPYAQLFRDFHMYLRQPAPDATLMRVAEAAIAAAKASEALSTA